MIVVVILNKNIVSQINIVPGIPFTTSGWFCLYMTQISGGVEIESQGGYKKSCFAH